MSIFPRRLFTVALCSCLLALGFPCVADEVAATAPIPVADFFQHAQFSGAAFSPDGKTIGMLIRGGNQRIALAVMEVGQLRPQIIANYEDKDVRSFHWVNNDRLVYDLFDENPKAVRRFFEPGLYAVNKDRTKRVQLVAHYPELPDEKPLEAVLPSHTYFYSAAHSGHSADIYVIQRTNAQSNVFELYRLNTLTGNTELIKRPGETIDWLFDRNGQPRVAVTIEAANAGIYLREEKTDQWHKLRDFPLFGQNTLTPEFISDDGDLYVSGNLEHDTKSLYRYDLARNQLDPEPVLSLQGYDFDGHLLYSASQKKVLGLRYEMGKMATLWFDEKAAAQQKLIDAQLPDTINLLSYPEHGTLDHALVYSFSDVEPGIWQLYDFTNAKFTRLGLSHPEIHADQMSEKTLVHYSARDGLNIPAYLTLPLHSSGKHLPMIVLVHGGPFMRGVHWDWDPQVQFLASRGYAVLEPEFRGSEGYGQRHFAAGFKQWGMAMQNDIADGAQWAAAQGYADAHRICIAGASYGGYATLMGLINDPQLYRCGIEWAGVTDINLLYNSRASDFSDVWKWYGMPVMVGDQIKDAAQLKATSPTENAARVTRPLLMAHGEKDRRVPIEHGQQFYKAVKDHNPDVEWVTYPEEAHGFRLLKNNLDFWTHVENFLKKYDGEN